MRIRYLLCHYTVNENGIGYFVFWYNTRALISIGRLLRSADKELNAQILKRILIRRENVRISGLMLNNVPWT